MTRINLVDPQVLLDQHLMAEYRELPMVPAALRRSLQRFTGDKPIDAQRLGIPKEYQLGTGHVKFFYNKRDYLADRYNQLIGELRLRGYQINPDDRHVDWTAFDRISNLTQYVPTQHDRDKNVQRLVQRYVERPEIYTYHKQQNTGDYLRLLQEG